MSLAPALEALKRNNYAEARALMARENMSTFTVQHFLIKGLAEMAMEDWVEAQDTFTTATTRFSDNALFWLNRGIAEENVGFIDAAIISQEKCLALNPKQAEASGNLANLYRKTKRFTAAEDMARRALIDGASKSEALNSLGLALGSQGKFAEADEALQKAQQEAPQNPDILSNRANLAIDQLHFDDAWKLFAQARAIEDKPIFRHDEGLARLLSGDYEYGFKLFEARLQLPRALRAKPNCPSWKGESLSGKKLLILAEQGFGDVIQFSRYEQFLTGAELVWAVPKNLTRLLTGNVRGTILCERDTLPPCDYFAPVLSLAFLTKQTKPVPLTKNFTAPPAPLLPQGKHRLKIGLVWAGSPTHERDHERSIKLEHLAPLLTTIDADFYATFTGDALNEIKNHPISRLDHLIMDFADTAALLKQMDYLITVDTAVAHLAGALGIKTYLLLAHCPDWRWGVSGNTTEWYPSVTLLRQPKHGDWKSVIQKFAELLPPC